MRLTKFGHSCLLVEEQRARMLLDPGTLSSGFEELQGLTAILYTHQHADHLDPDRLQGLLDHNPGVRVVSDEGSAKPLGQAGAEVEVVHDGDELEIGAVGVHIVGRDHAVIHPDIPVVPNVGYLGGVVMLSSLTSPLTPFVDALPLPARRLAREHQGSLRVRLRTGSHRFHRDLPESRVWTYDGSLPGPTIEAERGHPVRVDWRNELEGKLPVAVTLAPTATDRNGIPVQCLPGLSGGVPDANAASLPGFAVVHLHGGLTAAAYDGWAENIFAPGQHAVGDYAMDQRAALLWYHDHVMSVTRFTVYAGLAGMWIVRDERERDLGLPEGPPLELRLLLQDRNFGQDHQGRLTGELVHKTDPGTMEAFAPFTTVNGKVWPVLEVPRATYRRRVGWYSPRPSAPTCSSTSPTWRRAASSHLSTPPPRPSTARPSPQRAPCGPPTSTAYCPIPTSCASGSCPALRCGARSPSSWRPTLLPRPSATWPERCAARSPSSNRSLTMPPTCSPCGSSPRCQMTTRGSG